jgi:hypothetical protein
MTEKALWEFVYRADTAQKIVTAERWLLAHPEHTSKTLLEGLLRTLAEQSKRIFLAQLAEREEALRA